MNKKDLQNAIREFLLKDGNSPITEANLTKAQLDKREDYLKQLKKNKKELVKRYGKDAESVMYGRATNLAKKAVSEMNKQKLKELVRKSLMNENKEFTEEEIQQVMDAFHMSREDAIAHLQQSYLDYKQFDMGEGKKEDMDGNGDIDSKDYLLKRDAAIKKAKGEMKEDLDLGHQDDEPHMIKGELYQIGKYAMELYAMLEEYDEMGQEVDFPAWWQSKITVAKENLDGAKHYLEFEINEPKIDAAIDMMTGEEPHMGEPVPPMMENIGKDEILAGRLYKIKNFVQPAFYQKVRSLINSGDLETAEFFIKRMEPAAAKNDMEMAKMKGDLEDIDAVAAQRKKERQMANIFTEEIKDKVAKKLKEGLPKGYFKKELGIGGKKSVKEDWDTCIAKITDQGKSQKAAEKICGAINAAYVGHYRK